MDASSQVGAFALPDLPDEGVLSPDFAKALVLVISPVARLYEHSPSVPFLLVDDTNNSPEAKKKKKRKLTCECHTHKDDV